MARKTDYSKAEIIRRFRQIAERNQDWHAQQDTVLAGISCRGVIPEPHPEMPDVERRPQEGTAMNRGELRHCFRDVCKSVGWLKQCSNSQMTEAWTDRRNAQEELAEFSPPSGGWGRYQTLRADIERLKTARERVAKLAALDDEKRRLILIADEASRKFSVMEDLRFRFDECRLAYAGSFPEVSSWTPPVERDPEDLRKRVEIEIAEIDFDDIGLDGRSVFFVEGFGGVIYGDKVGGPLYFQSVDLANRFVDEQPKACISETKLTPDSVRDLLRWFVDRNRLISGKVDGGLLLYEQFPELVNVKPRDDSQLDAALETATANSTGW